MGSVAQQSVLLLSSTCSEQFTFTLGSEQDVLPINLCQFKRWASATSQSLLYDTGCMLQPAHSCCSPLKLGCGARCSSSIFMSSLCS